MAQQTWPEKLAQRIEEYAGKDIRDKVMTEWQRLNTDSEKAAWCRQVIARLDQFVPDEEIRRKIMFACSCPCVDDKIAEYRAEFDKTGSIDHLLDYMYKNPFMVRPVREGNTIYFTKIPYDTENFANAKTPEERAFHYCHCEYARAAFKTISPTHCFCGAGWYKHIMEGVLQRPVRVELLKSVLQGDDICQIAVHLD